MNICVYGAASKTIDKSFILAGENLGKELVKHGHSLVYGAGAEGMMGAVARGVHSEKGYILGVVPTFFTNEEILYLKCDKLVRTKTMRERKQIMEDNADAFIITPGGIGTFEEFFEILTLKQLAQHNKPIVIYNINGFYDSMLKTLDEAISLNFINKECIGMYPSFDNADDVLDYIENYKKMDLSNMKISR